MLQSAALFFFSILAGFCAQVHAETPVAAPTRVDRLKVLNSKKVSPRTIRAAEEQPLQTGLQSNQPTEEQAAQTDGSFLGLGISTLALSSAPTLSGVFQPSDSHQLQADLGIPSTNAFSMDISLGYRFGVNDFTQSGLHLGGFARMNLTANANATIDLAFSPAAGIHLAVTEDRRTLLSLDAGPTLSIAGGSLSFKFGALSSFLGLSIHRLF